MTSKSMHDLAALDAAIHIQRRIVTGMDVTVDYSPSPTAPEISAMHTWTKMLLRQLETARQHLLELEKAYAGSGDIASK